MEIVQKVEARADGSSVVVLCAEEATRDVIGYWFSALPVRTFVTSDGHEANRLLADATCRLLVTDRVLPPWPGLKTFIHLREDNPNLRIAYVDDGSPNGAMLARVTGARTVLSKPLTREAVIAALPRLEAVA
jgi:DNA-binding NtrC family response regulator